ncbi:MAG: LysR family transcriptional regulator [Spongiibacteraceae bacterium]
MQNIDWTDVHYCLAVIKQGSVTAAARELGVNHTTVSRRISALEATLEAPLFDRSTAGWSITPVAESILPNLEQMQEAASAIARSVSADRKELSGTIRVTAVDIFIQRVIMPGLKAFTEQYPHINLELLASDETLNLSVHAADIAFRITNEPPLDVVGKKIAKFAYGVYASRELWEQYQQGNRDIGAVSWMFDGSMVPEWLPQSYPDMKVRYRSNSFNVIFDLIQQGHGFGELPCTLGDSNPELVRVPASGTMETNGLWLLSHIDLRTTARIRIFRDFMLDYLQPLVPELEGDGPVQAFSSPALETS